MDVKKMYEEMPDEELKNKFNELENYSEIERKIITEEIIRRFKDGVNSEKNNHLKKAIKKDDVIKVTMENKTLKKIMGYVVGLFLLGPTAYNYVLSDFYKKIEINSTLKLMPFGIILSMVLCIIIFIKKRRKSSMIDICFVVLFSGFLFSSGIFQIVNYYFGNNEITIKGKIMREYILHKRGLAIEIRDNSGKRINIYIEKIKYLSKENIINTGDKIELEMKKGIFGGLKDPIILKVEKNKIKERIK